MLCPKGFWQTLAAQTFDHQFEGVLAGCRFGMTNFLQVGKCCYLLPQNLYIFIQRSLWAFEREATRWLGIVSILVVVLQKDVLRGLVLKYEFLLVANLVDVLMWQKVDLSALHRVCLDIIMGLFIVFLLQRGL